MKNSRVHQAKNVVTTLLLCLVLSVTVAAPAGAAKKETATLHNIKYGDKIPAFKAKNIATGKVETVSPGKGRPIVIMFFSIKPAFRKKRSLALLAALSDLSESYKNKVKFIGVYSAAKDRQVVARYMESSANKVAVYADPGKKIYDTFGVFMMPLVVIGNQDGRLQEVIPYTFNIRQLIDGNLKVLLGEWTKKQFHESLRPKKTAAKSEEEKEYIRRINYGRIMESKKMHAQAVREFSTAVKLMPDAIEGWLELGYALLAQKDLAKAADAFGKALSIDQESDDAIAGLGLVYYEQGDMDKAKRQLENAFISPKPRLEVIIALANIYEQEGDNVKANRLNKLAVNRLMTMYEQRWK